MPWLGAASEASYPWTQGALVGEEGDSSAVGKRSMKWRLTVFYLCPCGELGS